MSHTARTLVAASVAGLVAAVGAVGSASAEHHEHGAGDSAPCYGINKCKGTGDCGGKGHSCAGLNECAGQAFIKLEKEDCLRIEGGSLTPSAE